MDDVVLAKIFKTITEKLQHINYVLIGTLNLKFQGIHTEPSDVDFLTDKEGILAVAEIFNTPIINKHGYLELVFCVDDVEINFASDEPKGLRPHDFMKHVVTVNKYDVPIPCMSLQSEYETYKKMNREKDRKKLLMLKEVVKGK